MSQTEVLVIAHRGCAAEAPENTLASFKLALEQGCDAIELDIHLSQDDEIVVCHDQTIHRTTDKKGTIREMTVSQLKQADAGRWFHDKYKGEAIPLLEEVFDLVPAHIMINIEIKDSYEGAIEPQLIELLERKNRMSSVLVSSFDFKSLAELKRQAPEIPIGLLYSSNYYQHYALAEAMPVPVYSLRPHYKRINKKDVMDATSRGLKVYPYTVNSERDMERVLHDGVSGIITDAPGKLRRLLGK